jgi:hypothetical protein|tara:strand:+ start:92 stop:445 length:354 start_codon:yes stop_codon:yes gene_type:complete
MTQEKEIWTIEELVSLTENVQSKEVEYNGKVLPVQWCELSEAEEPKLDINPNDEDASDKYQELAKQRILGMIEKANEKNPDSVTLTSESWGALPMTLKYTIMNTVMGVDNPNLQPES